MGPASGQDAGPSRPSRPAALPGPDADLRMTGAGRSSPYAPRMLLRARAAVLTAAMALGTMLTGGCSTEEGPRPVGDPLTAAERRLLAEVLHRNHQRGGADFVVVASYGEAVLRLTGEIDFRRGIGHARAETAVPGDGPDDVRTLVFTRRHLWVGDVPGLSEALAGDGAGEAAYLARPLADHDEPAPPLVDVVASVLLRLAARSADDPEAFRAADYSWQGQRSIDSRLTTLFDLRHGTVAVDADDLLRQYTAPVGDGRIQVTVTFTDHGRRQVEIPAAVETALVADHPELAGTLGL